MKLEEFSEQVSALSQVCQLFGQRQWCLATSGNFSLRLNTDHCLITRSGCDKSTLSIDDLMICDFHGVPVAGDARPSAEAALHTGLYQLDPEIGAVLHIHTPASTAVSRETKNVLTLSGYEMQKAFAGVVSPEEPISIPVFENDQNIPAVAAQLSNAWHQARLQVPAFLIRNHGLYAWGRDLDEARRHTEGLQFLLECLLHEGKVSLP